MNEYVKYGDERMPCPYCGESISRFAKVCRFCNRTIDPVLRQLEENLSNRRQDGMKRDVVTPRNIPPVSIPVPAAKSRLTYILLAIFLGCLGMHNFYAGYAERGIAQLLITLLVGWLIVPLIVNVIWIIVEICVVDTDADGVKMREG